MKELNVTCSAENQNGTFVESTKYLTYVVFLVQAFY